MSTAHSALSQPLMQLIDVQKAPAQINSPSEESYPLLDPQGRLYFVRSIFDENVGGVRAGQDIWYVEPRGNGWSDASNDLGKLNNIFNNGVVGVTDSGDVLYLNSTYSNKLDYQIGLSRSELKNGEWTKPKRVRLKSFNPKTGFLSFYVDDDQGVMFLSFSSSIALNEDLYVSVKEDGVWQKPIRLGPAVNTTGAEFSPYLSEDGRVLYFSSTGHGGLGGADIFYCRRTGDSWTAWSDPIPLEAPINSPAFDAYFTLFDTTAFFSSNRDGEFSDIYIATYAKRVQAQRPALAEEDTSGQAPFVIVGQVTDKKLGKLDGVDVVDKEGEVVMSVDADENGEFVLENLEDERQYYIELSGKLDDPSLTLIVEGEEPVGLQREVDRNRFMFELGNRKVKTVIPAKVMVATRDDGTTLFSFADPSLFSNSARVSLIDAAGKEVEKSKIDEDGAFSFKKLNAGDAYSLRFSGVEDQALKQAVFVTKDSTKQELSEFILKGFPFQKLSSGDVVMTQEELLSSNLAAKFAFDYDRLDMYGSTVFLYDENGKEIQRAFVNNKGFFAFDQLDPERKYSMGLESEADKSKGPPQLYGFDEDDERVALAKGILDGEDFIGYPVRKLVASEDRDVFSFDESNVPPAGTKVYLTDENDNVVDSSYVDADGNFSFGKLSPYGEYKIKLANTDDLSMGLDRFFIVDAEGSKIEVDETGATTKSVVGQAKAAATETFTFSEEGAPPEGTVVYLTDENDNVIDSAVVDESGEVRFTRLPPDGNFKLKLDKAVDNSMGLGRFFIVDATGDKIGFDEEGKTTKSIIGEDLAEKTETFKISGEDGGPPPGTMVYATDDVGNVIDSAVVDEDGEVRFTRLPPDGNFKLKLEKAEDTSMGLSRFFIVDASGDEISFNEDGETTQKVVGKALAATTETFKVSGDAGGPPPGTMVYATDDVGNVIDSAVVDESGEVKFTRLPPDGNYKLKLEKVEDNSMGLSRFFIVDASGDQVEFNEDGETTKKIAGKAQAATTEVFQVSGEDGGPPPGTMVYATDDVGNVIDSAVVDESGEVKFTRLPPDGNYKLKLEKVVDNSMGLDRFFVVDATGEAVSFNEKGETQNTVVGKSKADLVNYYNFPFGKLPPEGAVVYLLDGDNNIIDSAVVGSENKFRFLKLDPDQKYGMEIKNADGSVFHFGSMVVTDKDGNSFELNEEVSNPTYYASLTPEERDAKFDQFQFEAQKRPVVGTKVYIRDDAGNVVDSAVIYSHGRFNVDRLERQQTYNISVGDDQFDERKAALVAIVKEQRRRLPYLRDGFSYRPIDPVVAEDTELNFARYDQFLLATDNGISESSKAMLYEEGNSSPVQQSPIEQDGSFRFKELNRGTNYEVAFEGVDVETASLYSISEDAQNELTIDEDGRARITPSTLVEAKPSIQLENVSPRLSSIQGDSSLQGDAENYPPLPNAFKSLTEEERAARYDVFQFDSKYLPDRDSKVVISDEQGNEVTTAKLYEGGTFFVDKLSGEIAYRIKVQDKAFSIEGADLYQLVDRQRKKLERLDEYFVFRPSIEEEDSRLKSEFVLSLKGDEPAERKEEEDFPLTRPIDDENKEVPIEEEDKVNKTVFEKQQPVEEAKPAMATAVLDESDFRLKSGIAQVIETEKGWNMHFDFNEFLLSEFQIDYVYEVVIPMLRKNPDMTLVLEGHTDAVGTDDVNYRVSIMRISSVLYHLEMAGIEDTRIAVLPKGESEPIAPNDTEMGRAKNRRVEIVKDEELEKLKAE